MKDPCKDKTLLSALLDHELPEKQRLAVRRHLRTCPECRRELRALHQAGKMVRRLEPLEPSADFDRVFWRRITELERRKSDRGGFLHWFGDWRPLLASGLAAGVVAALFIWVGQNRKMDPEELFIAEHIELLENYDMLERLDMLEQWDALEALKEPS